MLRYYLDGEDDQRPPALEPYQDADVVDVYTQEHRVAGNAVRSILHQMLGPGRNFVVISVKGVAFADLFHVCD